MAMPAKQYWISWAAAALLAASLSSAAVAPAFADAMDDLDAAVNAFRGGDNERALALMDGAIASGELEADDLARAYSNRGIILNAMERREDAAASFSRAI